MAPRVDESVAKLAKVFEHGDRLLERAGVVSVWRHARFATCQPAIVTLLSDVSSCSRPRVRKEALECDRAGSTGSFSRL